MSSNGNVKLNENHVLNGTLQSSNKLSGTIFNDREAFKGNLHNAVLRGYSAYQVAVSNGYEGSEEEWIESLKGESVVFKQEGSVLYWKYENESDDQYEILLDLSGQEKDYSLLNNKPKINEVELNGDMSLDSLGLIGHGLKYDDQNKKLAVDMAGDVEKDNTLPISSASVYTTVGNIQELLKTI